MAAQYAKDQPAGFVNRIERVAIIGASGSIGRPVTEALLKTGKHTVTALTRLSSNASLPSGVVPVQVDYDDEASIISALKDQQILIISLPATAAPDLHDRIVTAASKAGVRHVMPNAWGAEMQNESLLKESIIGNTYIGYVKKTEELGLTWTNLCSGFWYEFSVSQVYQYGMDIVGRKAILYGDGTVRINTSTWPQCGRAVAAWLSLKALPEDENDTSPTVSSWNNKPIYISSFLISQREMLDSLQRVQGTTDADWEISKEDVKARYQRGIEMLQQGNMLGFVLAMYSRYFFTGGGGDHENTKGLDNEVLGLPKEDLDEATATAVRMAEAAAQ